MHATLSKTVSKRIARVARISPAGHTPFKRSTPQGLGIAITERRIALGLTQKQVGLIAGFDSPTVSRLENGRMDFRLSTLVAVLNAVGLDLTVIDLQEST